MITKFLFLALGVAALTSCSTAYRMGQTPDDVYFSPGKEVQEEEYVVTERQSNRYTPAERYNSYDDYDAYRNDRFLRMSIGSSMRMSAFDDYYWNGGLSGYNSWKYNNFAYNWYSPWNSYYYWNNFYNPYSRYNFYNPYYGYGNVIVGTPGKAPISSSVRPRAFNSGAYNNNTFRNNNLYLYRNPGVTRPNSAASSGLRYNNTNSYYSNDNRSGGSLRRNSATPNNNTYYNNSNNSRRNNTYTPPSRNYDAPARSYSPSSSGSSSSGSSGGSSGTGVSRPGRN